VALSLQACAPLTSTGTSLGVNGRPLDCSKYEHIFYSAQLGDDLRSRGFGGARASANLTAHLPIRRLSSSTEAGLNSLDSEANTSGGHPPDKENILILSGGGAWGAYGAGFINGMYGTAQAAAADGFRLSEVTRITGISTGR
jgi:hypothetical protein